MAKKKAKKLIVPVLSIAHDKKDRKRNAVYVGRHQAFISANLGSFVLVADSERALQRICNSVDWQYVAPSGPVSSEVMLVHPKAYRLVPVKKASE